MPSYSVTPGTMPDPFCPDNWQDVLETISERQSVAVPTNTGVVIQAGTPAVSDQDKLWIKLDAAVPYVVGAYVFSSGGWRRIPGLPIYYADGSGTPNSIVITTGDSISNAGFIAGRIFLVRVANTVTGATTVTLDSLPATGLKKANDNDIESGDIESGQLILIAYDSTSSVWELLNVFADPVIFTRTSSTVEALETSLPSSAGYANAATVAHGLGAKPGFVDVFLKCTDAGGDAGWPQNSIINPSAVSFDTGASDHNPHYSIDVDDTSIRLIRPKIGSGSNGIIMNRTTGDDDVFTPTKWKMLVRAIL